MTEDLQGGGLTAASACARCGTALAPAARFCISCGAAVSAGDADGDAQDGRSDTPRPRDQAGKRRSRARLMTCEGCGARNAASRALCARCDEPLRDEVPGGNALPDPSGGEPFPVGRGAIASAAADPLVQSVPAAAAPQVAPDRRRTFLALLVLGCVLLAGIVLAVMAGRPAAPDGRLLTEGVALSGIRASSELAEHPATSAIDGEVSTAWAEAGAGDDGGAFLVLELGGVHEVQRVLVWNGDQGSDEDFQDNGRAARLRVEVGDRQFRVELQDVPGPQAVELPEGVTASTVRLVIESAIPGDRHTNLAISEVVVEAASG